jgi:ribosomal protein S25
MAFHVDDLRQHVLGQVAQIAPDSPGRILRLLRERGRLDYIVLNRRQSLYLFM